MLQSIIFIAVSAVAFGLAARQFLKIRRNILLGQPEEITGDSLQRWQNVALVAFGQSKMFKRWIPAVLHLFIYVAFVITQVELIEILIDGATGIHRFFWPLLGSLYTFIISFIEVLSVLAFVGTIIFLIRRNALKIPRFTKAEMKGWPTLDANIILYLEVLLIGFIFTMNGADMALHDNEYGFAVSQFVSPLFEGFSDSTLHTLERIGWWGHILVVFVFLNYLPFSKHLHILLAFPNTYYAKLNSRGEMENMPEIMNEVKSMMGLIEDTGEMDMEAELPEFGAKDVTGLSWKNIMDAYACTECGRCTSVCPANMTGKKLSPRKILMDIRDRATDIGLKLDSGNIEYIREDLKAEGVKLTAENFDDGKSLFDFISKEELHACTTCNACVEACPVLINPLDPILKMRRYEILTLSEGPSDWLPMFNSIENSGAVWSMPVERDQWAKDLANG
ncbi:MAG: (Fe-S)-binding protein [Bacteroidota bacterium]